MRISKMTNYYIETIANHEGISPSKALEALVAMGYDSWIAWRTAQVHSSPKLTEYLQRSDEIKREIHMRQAKVPEPESAK
jgi:hypothetical protein